MTEHERLAALCQQLGATAAQADTMAAQLLKRARQLSAERGTSPESELQKLLHLLAQGRGGQVPPGFTPPPPRPSSPQV